EPDVTDIELARRIKEIGVHTSADERARRQLRYEMLRCRRQDAAVSEPALLQPSNEIERLVRGDSAADDQQNALDVRRRNGTRRAGTARQRSNRRGRPQPANLSRLAQDIAHFVLHRAPVARGAQAQLLFEPLIELADGE